MVATRFESLGVVLSSDSAGNQGDTMNQPVSMDDIRQLSVAERLLLVEEISDSISDQPDSWTLSPKQRAELERRAAAHRDNPDDGVTWDEVKAGLRNRS